MSVSGNPGATLSASSVALLQGTQPGAPTPAYPQAYATPQPYMAPQAYTPYAAQPTGYGGGPVPAGQPSGAPQYGAYQTYGSPQPAGNPLSAQLYNQFTSGAPVPTTPQPLTNPQTPVAPNQPGGNTQYPTYYNNQGSAQGGGLIEDIGNAVVTLTRSAQSAMDQVEEYTRNLLNAKNGQLDAQDLALLNQLSSSAALRMEEAKKMRENQERMERAAVA